jgi:hypothetical protein
MEGMEIDAQFLAQAADPDEGCFDIFDNARWSRGEIGA